MLVAIIDNGSTWLLDIRDNINIDGGTLNNEWNKRYVGWLVNTDFMPDIISNFPIRKFMLKLPDGFLMDISFEQAIAIYEGLVELRKESNNKMKK